MAGLKEVLSKQAQLPERIEQALPAAAPKISTVMKSIALALPVDPNLPVNPLAPNDTPPAQAMDIIKGIEDALPDLPEIGQMPTAARAGNVRIVPLGGGGAPITQEYVASPSVGVIPEVITRRGM